MKRTLESLTDETFDLLILGGGITGAGVALDAALRGLRVALIDKGDFASGTSSVSSKLVHGGLRYLEHGDFHLVYEALHERRALIENAPHLVHPLRFLIPYYRGSRVPQWKWSVGLTLYDLLAGRGNLRRSHRIPSRNLRGEVPGLRAEGLRGGAAYYDAQMDDARLCVEVLMTAAEHGACVANYVEATGFEWFGGLLSGVRASDRVGGLEFVIRARQIVNATGPWGDAILKLAGDNSGPNLQPTKGVHLVAPDRGLPAAFLLLHPADGRVFFVIPWLGKTLIGTTDTFADEPPDALHVTDADIAYLLEGHNRYLQPELRREDILGSFAGLRPLLRSKPGDPSAISREFRLIESPSGLLTAAGGKFTTYRRMAEVITDAVVRRLKLQRRGRTRHQRLHGAPPGDWREFEDSETVKLVAEYGLGRDVAWHLVHRYGTQAAKVAEYVRNDPKLGERVVGEEPDLRAELAYQRDHEMAVMPADSLLRRTRLGLFRPELAMPGLPPGAASARGAGPEPASPRPEARS